MAGKWRISTINGLLLAVYFVPVWLKTVLSIVTFPIRGIYERATIGPALFFSDQFHLSTLGTVRFAWLVALIKFVVVVFFALFVVLALRGSAAKRAEADEPLAVALALGGLVSLAGMMMAARVGEVAAMHLHATEVLMLYSGLVLLVVDSETYGVKRRIAAPVDAYVLRPIS